MPKSEWATWLSFFELGVPGQSVVQAAQTSGATVIGVYPVPFRRAMAERMGASHTLDTNATAVAAAVKNLDGGVGADTIWS